MTLIEFFSPSIDTPKMFSLFHLIFLIIMFVSCVLIAIFCRKANEKTTRIILFSYSITSIFLEVIKLWCFKWNMYYFPFQFCSTPMYLALISAIFSKRKIADWLNSYLATFGLLAGLLVMFYPNSVFCQYPFINIQTMFLHGGMVIIGFYLLISGKVKYDKITDFLKGVAVFGICVFIAFILNIADKSLTLFYISPYTQCELPVLCDIKEKTPYIVFLLCYILSFSLGAFLFFLPKYIVLKIENKKTMKNNKQNEVAVK